ncbi:MAG: ParB/RepB/Spo0J family partition protein [Candidatus Heimdallarchaeota archaeon]
MKERQKSVIDYLKKEGKKEARSRADLRVKTSNIILPWYAPREEFDDDFIDELASSMDRSGQWDDLILRQNPEGKFELISGSQRLTAARKIGWDEIDAKVVDVTEAEAAVMALESNILRRGLKEIEEGKAIKKMMDKLDINQKQVAERLRRSQSWVGTRLSLALEVADEVQEALVQQKISVSQAIIIGQLKEEDKQRAFLEVVLEEQKKAENRKLTADETRRLRTRFLNDTIYTIGYGGWDIEEFVETLKKNKVSILIDIRDSGKSTHKPEFARNLLEKSITSTGIKFFERSNLGVPYDIRAAVRDGGLSTDCFRQWYIWHVMKRDETNKVAKLAEEIKDLGAAAFMCAERYAKPKGQQKHHCHRDFLAELILDTKLFEKRIDF